VMGLLYGSKSSTSGGSELLGEIIEFASKTEAMTRTIGKRIYEEICHIKVMKSTGTKI